MDKAKILNYASKVNQVGSGYVVTHNNKALMGSTISEVVAKMLSEDELQKIRETLAS